MAPLKVSTVLRISLKFVAASSGTHDDAVEGPDFAEANTHVRMAIQWRIQDLEKVRAHRKNSVGLDQFLLTGRLQFLGNIYHLLFTTSLGCFYIKKISIAFIVNNFSIINAV